MSEIFKKISVDQIATTRAENLDEETLKVAADIIADIKSGGEATLRSYAERFADVGPGAQLIYQRSELEQAYVHLDLDTKGVLDRTAKRIELFASLQRESVRDLEVEIPGGRAGHKIRAVERAACYAPGGRFPLPSSVLMTAITARVAGVSEVWVASPKPTLVTLAAAYIAGADSLLAVGGAQAIAALAYGAGSVPACNIIVGPGNRFVTAAKKLVSGDVAIDMLAGPSELLVVVDDTSDLQLVAADLLAQAEHDTDALPVVVSLSDSLYQPLISEIRAQLDDLSTKEIAEVSLQNGFFVNAASLEEAAEICNRIAPEHLQVMTDNPDKCAGLLYNYGGLFIGEQTAEVFGDYGAGPNHVLPTSGTARYTAGLSVMNFLRFQTWIKVENSESARILAKDSSDLAKLEGLEGHAKAAEFRLDKRSQK